MTTHEKLPDNFIEMMEQYDNQDLIKRFSGKILLKIARIKNNHNRKESLKLLINTR
jgi:hypothetical protein